MKQEQQLEFARLRAEALRRLREGAGERGRGVPVLQLLVRPSFEASVGHQLLTRASEGQPTYALERGVWDMRSDAAKLESPVTRLRYPRDIRPTIAFARADIAQSAAEAILNQVARLTLSPMPADAPFGVDGTLYELQFGGLFAFSCFTWWERPPPCWAPLGSIASAVLELGAAAFA